MNMTNNTTGLSREDALSKIAKLLALAGGAGTQEEAAAAAGQAQKLMNKYRIEASMLAEASVEERDPDEPIVDFVGKGGADAALGVMGKQFVAWKLNLANGIARANGCSVYYVGKNIRGVGFRQVIGVVGRASDADTVRYLYTWLDKEVDRIAAKAARGMGRVWGRNFRLGMVECIGERLHAAQQEAEDEAYVAAKAQDDTAAAEGAVPRESALVVVDRAIARVADRRKDVRAWVKKNMKLRTVSRAGGTYDPSARDQGRDAGSRVGLGGKSRGGLAAGHKKIGSGR